MNFSFLKEHDEYLYYSAHLAEAQCHRDPEAARVHLRKFGERLTELLAIHAELHDLCDDDQCIRIDKLHAHGLLPEEMRRHLHRIRLQGNRAAHEHRKPYPAVHELKMAHEVACWFALTLDPKATTQRYRPPKAPATAHWERGADAEGRSAASAVVAEERKLREEAEALAQEQYRRAKRAQTELAQAQESQIRAEKRAADHQARAAELERKIAGLTQARQRVDHAAVAKLTAQLEQAQQELQRERQEEATERRKHAEIAARLAEAEEALAREQARLANEQDSARAAAARLAKAEEALAQEKARRVEERQAADKMAARLDDLEKEAARERARRESAERESKRLREQVSAAQRTSAPPAPPPHRPADLPAADAAERRAAMAKRAAAAATELRLEPIDLDRYLWRPDSSTSVAEPPAPAAKPPGKVPSPTELAGRHSDEFGALFTRLAQVSGSLSAEDEAVLAAFRRSATELSDGGATDVREYLMAMEPHSVAGVVANVKGILHEQAYVAAENSDGDPIVATLFEHANHPGTDVVLRNGNTGESWEVQLKATDSESYVQAWLDAHPGEQIQITSELAEQMGLASSGVADAGLELQVEDFLDQLDDLPIGNAVWRTVPVFSLASLSIVVYGLWRRHRAGELSREEFERRLAWATGWKLAKAGLLAVLMSLPVINVITSAVIVARLLIAADGAFGQGRTRAWLANCWSGQRCQREGGGGSR